MAEVSQFTIVTFQRQPGLWRASMSHKECNGITVKGTNMLSLITSSDCTSEGGAKNAAIEAIKKL
jgi:hypothetical protein